MKIYSRHGFKDFVVALGYMGSSIKEYLLNLSYLSTDFSVDVSSRLVTVNDASVTQDWMITALDTGEDTQTGGRILRAGRYINEEFFMVTYGDGLATVDVKELVRFHLSHPGAVTVTAVRPPARFGRLTMDGPKVVDFGEKPTDTNDWINGGFFVMSRRVLDYIDGPSSVFEREPLERLALDGELYGWRHEGFWQPMDTLRDRRLLEEMSSRGEFPWLGRTSPS